MHLFSLAALKTGLWILWAMDEEQKKMTTHNGSDKEVVKAEKQDQPKAPALQKSVSLRKRCLTLNGHT